MFHMIAQSKSTVSIVDVEDSHNGYHNLFGSMSMTDLDSHANMVVLGRYARVVAYTRKIAQVSLFIPAYKSMENVLIIDGGVTYKCPYSGKCYVFL